MPITSMKFRKHPCFATEFAGFDEFKAINIIIGRNNVGKSKLLDLVERACSWPASGQDRYEYLLAGTAEESSMRRHFPSGGYGTDLLGDYWADNGARFLGVPVTWERSLIDKATAIRVVDGDVPLEKGYGASFQHRVSLALGELEPPFRGRVIRRLVADRDVEPEAPDQAMKLNANGRGATNIIRRHITSAELNREYVQSDLRNALNEIFGSDGHFTEIQTKEYDAPGASKWERGTWEIYLGQAHKDLVPLSGSGSGLKTVILVLLHLLVMPKVDGSSAQQSVFVFEELENNLHPALLRRLLSYIERFAVANATHVFLTTHSSVALDMFGASNDAQIVHVTHDGRSARTATVVAHFDRLGVIGELGARPSDLLQANGIIWVEGPSDVVYLNHWIHLASNGKLREGRDYQCAFYGGALLARTKFVGELEADGEFINLLRINPNVIVVCDSDRTSAESPLKARVQRIKDELSLVPQSEMWITRGKEIESYLPGKLLGDALGIQGVSEDPTEYELIFPNSAVDGTSYLERVLKRRSVDKIDLAARCANATFEDFAERFDWQEQMGKIVEAIERWNR